MDKARIGALLLIAFFVVSIIAYSFIYRYPEVQTPPSNEQPTKPTQISMQAKNVSATVVILLPRMKIMAQTNEAQISAIDSKIYSIAGVKGISSNFILPQQIEVSAGITYIADIQISDVNSAANIILLIEEKAPLEDVEVFPYAIVNVPKQIEFFNEDLNISKEYSLKGDEALTLVSFQTIPNDSIIVEISATFIGNDVLQALAFEAENISATPILGEAAIEANVASLQQRLLVDITSNYSQLPLLDSIKQQIASMQGISDFNLSKPDIDPKISLMRDENISEEKAADLNSFLHALSNDVIFYNKGTFMANIFFEQGIDLLPLKDSINAKLQELDLNLAMREASGHAAGAALLESSDASAIMPKIKSLLESKSFEEFSVLQPGEISLAEITADDGKIYSIESGLVEAEFSSPHLLGEKANVEISYYLVRGEIASIGAVEK